MSLESGRVGDRIRNSVTQTDGVFQIVHGVRNV